MKRPILSASACAVVVVVAAIAYMASPAPSLGSNPDEAADTERLVPYFSEGAIVIPESFATRVGIEYKDVVAQELAPVAHVTGTVGFNEHEVAAVGPRIAGRIVNLEVVEGDSVVAGDILATIESAELGSAQADVFAAEARMEAARAQEIRRRNLLDEGVGSKRMAEEAVAEARISRAELLASKQRVLALGGESRGKGLGQANLRAPIGGHVVQVDLFRGQAIAPSQNVFLIADLETLWINLSVFEGELSKVTVGDPVEIRPQADPNLLVKGTVAHVGSIIDPETRSARVRVVVDNKDGELRVGQSVAAKIRTTGESRMSLAVPATSVIRVDGQPTVFVRIEETNRIEVRTVKIGESTAEYVEVTEGLMGGESVVTKGVFELKSELFR